MEPIPGDPSVLRGTGERYLDTAEAIRAAVSSLEQIARPGAMVSLALDRVRSDAARIGGEIAAAERRYAETGEAMTAYAVALAAAQEEAEWAIRDAEHAAAEQLEDAAAARSVATERHAEAVADRDRAARDAIERIRECVEGSGLDDRFWDDVAGALRGVVDVLSRAADALVEVLLEAVAAIVELAIAVLVVIAAVILLGVVVLTVVVAAIVAIAVLAVLLAAMLVVAIVAAVLVAGLVVVAFAVIALLCFRMLAGLLAFLSCAALLTIVNLLRGDDPVEAWTQAAVASLLLAFPELWIVIHAASRREAGTPVFEGARPVEPPAEYTFGTMYDDLIAIDAAGHLDPRHPELNEQSVVRIIPFAGPDGSTIYRVHIPSTQQWTPGGTSGNDVTSDVVAKMDQDQQTQLEKMVIDAMQRAGVEPGDHVMLAGWSLGGITAGNLAADPEFGSTYRVDAIAVSGASVDDLDIPLHTRVLDVSHSTDPVPRTEHPFSGDHSDDPNRYRIDVPPPGGAEQLGHSSVQYQETVERYVDAGGSAAGARYVADDPDDPDGVQVSDYFGTPAVGPDGVVLGGHDYAYTRGD